MQALRSHQEGLSSDYISIQLVSKQHQTTFSSGFLGPGAQSVSPEASQPRPPSEP